jgi:hypothetical protein
MGGPVHPPRSLRVLVYAVNRLFQRYIQFHARKQFCLFRPSICVQNKYEKEGVLAILHDARQALAAAKSMTNQVDWHALVELGLHVDLYSCATCMRKITSFAHVVDGPVLIHANVTSSEINYAPPIAARLLA